MNSILLEGILFSSTAAVIVLLSIWWLYFSPLKPPKPTPVPISTRLSFTIAGFIGLAGLLWTVGALWDASMHLSTGEIPGGSDFLWPPHLVLYTGFLIVLVVALASLAIIALPNIRRGILDPRRSIRQSPYLGAVALAAFYELAALPGDALWHELIGPDLTAWSPPHILLAVSVVIVMICSLGLLMQAPSAPRLLRWRDSLVALLLGLMLNTIYLAGVLEWELPFRTALVDERPVWLYPLVGGCLSFFVLVLARNLITFRLAAISTAFAFYLVRFSISSVLNMSGNIAPAPPLIFILGAILIDLQPDRQIRINWLRWMTVGLLYTLGYALLAFPLLPYISYIKALTANEYFLAGITTLLTNLLIWPIAIYTSKRLRVKSQTVP